MSDYICSECSDELTNKEFKKIHIGYNAYQILCLDCYYMFNYENEYQDNEIGEEENND